MLSYGLLCPKISACSSCDVEIVEVTGRVWAFLSSKEKMLITKVAMDPGSGGV